ncbi:CYTH domain-containing protein [Candidatus Magnetaquicoccus inordinatus]|uniref:CYTH domain-containing protein n=1 Tax=Candidatus Magnetaquicoccus inordinatus TaxID=2496818 RepID=UPI00102C344B|nr:CYTH domain-containing protein [Candidatus Magnetaquicoccus inordinatus]
MGQEIERRFLVDRTLWEQSGLPQARSAQTIRQGFLSTVKERVVRVRLNGEQGSLTIKGITRGISKLEFDYPIPADDARQMLDELCQPPLIEKIRYQIDYAGLLWEVDAFSGANQGLLLAEVELTCEEQSFLSPPWLGEEVSLDPRYFNSSLSRKPFSEW